MAPTETRVIKLPGGSILASQQGDIVRARGVKYALASRFERSQPVPSWEGVIDCTKPAPICPQRVPSRLDFVTGPINAPSAQDEDCLNVRVTTLARHLTGPAKAPVMVFYHGGAYLSGGGDNECYEPSALVSKGVVGVNVTSRLGIFGYLPIPGVAPANLGLLDQIAALRWVQDNIASFGGDKNNVTLFGESAGGDSIQCIMLAEGTEDLYHKAILESAPVGIRGISREPMVSYLGDIAREALSPSQDGGASPKTTAEMLGLQMQLLMAAQKYPESRMAFGPVMGADPLPKLSDISRRTDEVAPKKPLLIGYTRDEGRPFTQLDNSLRAYINLPLVGGYFNAYYAGKFATEVFKSPSQKLHQQFLKVGGRSHLYEFNWSPPGSPLGSSHCLELPFVLGYWDAWKEAPMLGGAGSREDVETIGPEMRALWVAFAKGETDIPQKIIIDRGFRFPNGGKL